MASRKALVLNVGCVSSKPTLEENFCDVVFITPFRQLILDYAVIVGCTLSQLGTKERNFVWKYSARKNHELAGKIIEFIPSTKSHAVLKLGQEKYYVKPAIGKNLIWAVYEDKGTIDLRKEADAILSNSKDDSIADRVVTLFKDS